MIEVRGYPRETPQEAGYTVESVWGITPDRELVLVDSMTGKKELWTESPHYAGYAIEYDGSEFEFVRDCVGRVV